MWAMSHTLAGLRGLVARLCPALLLLAFTVLSGCGRGNSTATPVPKQDQTPAPTITPSPTPTARPLPSPTPTSQVISPVPSTQTLKGVSLSPKSFSPVDFADFFNRAKEAGVLISWAGDWNELGNTTGGGPKVLAELAPTYSYMPVILAQFFTQSSGKLLRPMDAATTQRYKDILLAFVDKYRPSYVGLGIEVNMLYEKSPADFERFVQLFDELYEAVKSVSPRTKVFTVFQLEKMKGLSGGLFGGRNDPNNAQWHLLDRFPDSDIIAFTTYPGLIYKGPEQIPQDYYSDIKSHTSKPIAFTEVGWHTASSPLGWESSEVEQSEFVETFFNLTRGLDTEMVIWSFLYDQSTIEPFNSMGLLRNDGNAKPAWDQWTRAR